MSEPNLKLRERVGTGLLGWRVERLANDALWYYIYQPNGERYCPKTADSDEVLAFGAGRRSADPDTDVWTNVPPWESSLDACLGPGGVGEWLERRGWRIDITWRPHTEVSKGVDVMIGRGDVEPIMDEDLVMAGCPRGTEAATLCRLALRVAGKEDGT